MEERRHAVRRPVSWVVRLWLNDMSSIGGRAADASTHGLWVRVNWLPSGTLRAGRVYRVEVQLETGERRTYAAALRRTGEHGVGLEVSEELPVPSVL
ncbi:MAG: hypothetical protein DME06_09910 [Candidatus Rokuibacteriota bacterium]|nr:MAG: hypothetical protein DME09_02805 [Candidatus Rokubacteria bacterium]PYN12214.1 MAG: hypothetical protein DME06_09910 [Candidatus Rokubacteria bacterium]